MAAPVFKDPRSERIYSRLRQIGEGASSFFSDAYQLIEGDLGLETQSHLAAHAIRELESSVRQVLAAANGVPVRKTDTTGQPLTEILASLLGTHDQPPWIDALSDVEKGLRKALAVLTGRKSDDAVPAAAAKTITGILDALEFEPKDPVREAWKNVVGKHHRLAHRANLGAPRPLSDELRTIWSDLLVVLDHVLDRFEASYDDIFATLDTLLAIRKPSRDDVNRLARDLPQTPTTLGYFFDRLAHEGWFGGLRRAGLLQHPPDAAPGSGQPFPFWAAADYLRRMAPRLPTEVTALLLEVETDNLRAQRQFLEICMELPVEQVVRLVSRIRSMIPTLSQYEFFGEPLIDLARRLAEHEHGVIALTLFEDLLAARLPRTSIGDRTLADREGVAYALERSADALLMAMIEDVGISVLKVLVPALAVRLDPNQSGSFDNLRRDHSTIWLPHFGSVSQRRRSEMRSFLATQIRSVASALIIDGESPDEVAALVRSGNTTVFKRLLLRLCADHPRQLRALAVKEITSDGVFGDPDCYNELAALLPTIYPDLTEDERATVLERIREGPDFSWEEDEARRDRLEAKFERNWLALLERYLSGEDLKRLHELTAQIGPAEVVVDPGVAMAISTGPNSPLEQGDIEALGPEKLVDYLSTWEPDEGFTGRTPEGLGRELARVVATHPTTWARAAASFRDQDATYVRALFNGLREACLAEKDFSWDSLLDLAEWVVAQSIPESDTVGRQSLNRDPDWRFARQELLRLLTAAMSRKDGRLKTEYADRVWQLISTMAEDPNPSRGYEEEWGGTNQDPDMLALNTVRPQAVSLAISFLWWLNRANEDGTIPVGFEGYPEVARLLEDHLDPQKDRSLAVRASIGAKLEFLVWFDSDWVKEHAELLFPKDPDSSELRHTMFTSYLRRGPSRAVDQALRSEYEAAIGRSSDEPEDDRRRPGMRLAEHLMNLFWWGSIGLPPDDDLLALFFNTAPAALRRHAIHFVGWSLYGTEDPVTEDIGRLLKDLWEWRARSLLEQVESEAEGSALAAEELREFGWWFASRVFDETWAMQALAEVLGPTRGVQWDQEVAAYLADLSEHRAGDTIAILALFDPTGGGDFWEVAHWLSHARTVMEAGLRDSDEQVCAATRRLVNRWIAAGHLGLRDLL